MTAEGVLHTGSSKLTMRVSALVGLLAVFGMLALAAVHDAAPHTHRLGHVVEMDHHHDHGHQHHHEAPSNETPDSADLVHSAMHAVFSTLFPIPAPLVSALLPIGVFRWKIEPVDDAESIQPNRILRPPRG